MKKLTVSLAALALLLTGCSSSGSTGTEAPTVERTHAAEESPEAKDSPKPEDKPEAKMKENKKKPPKPKKEPKDSFSGPKVNAEDYYIAPPRPEYASTIEYYFTSPSGMHRCSITENRAGCSSQQAPVDAPIVEVLGGYAGEVAPAWAVTVGSEGDGPAHGHSLSDATFLTPDGSTAKALPYGHVLEIFEFKCTTEQTLGVICTNGTNGFEWATQGHKLY